MDKILFMGLGHMGKTIAENIIKQKTNVRNEVEFEESVYNCFGYHYDDKKAHDICAEMGIQPIYDLEFIANWGINMIVIGVRPNSLEKIAETLSKSDLSNIVICSMASGVEIAELEKMFAFSKPKNIVRIMPNMNAKVQKSITGICFQKEDEQKEEIIKVFETCGEVIEIEEKLFSTFTITAGCMPAYLFSYAKGFIDSAVNNGLSQEAAKKVVLETIIGSAEMMKESQHNAQELIDQVCVPDGVTIEGMKILNDGGFEKLITNAFEAALVKDKNIRK